MNHIHMVVAEVGLLLVVVKHIMAKQMDIHKMHFHNNVKNVLVVVSLVVAVQERLLGLGVLNLEKEYIIEFIVVVFHLNGHHLHMKNVSLRVQCICLHHQRVHQCLPDILFPHLHLHNIKKFHQNNMPQLSINQSINSQTRLNVRCRDDIWNNTICPLRRATPASASPSNANIARIQRRLVHREMERMRNRLKGGLS
jgi:hypothetical protein